MTRPAATCEVYVDGVRAPDTAADYTSGQVTVLAGVVVSWGREDAFEQPSPATCRLTVDDLAATSDFLSSVHVGSKIDVRAQGPIPAGPDGWTLIDDGTMNSWKRGDAVENRYAAADGCTALIAETLTGHARAMYVSGAPNATVTVPPRRYATPTDLPTVWDETPNTTRGDQPWTVTVQLQARVGAQYQVIPYGFSSPYGDGDTLGAAAAGIGTGTWQTVIVKTDPQLIAAGTQQWVGVRVVVVDFVADQWSGEPGTWAAQPAARTWAAAGAVWLDDITIDTPPGAVLQRRVSVFNGTVSDLKVAPTGVGSIRSEVTAVDLGATLAHRIIGDEPWPMQPATIRAERILELAGGDIGAAALRIGPNIANTKLSFRDVDAQPASGLLQDLAQSIGGVLWMALNAIIGPYVWIEDPRERAAVRQFIYNDGIITIEAVGRGGTSTISACDVLMDPVSWLQDVSDVVTTVNVGWLEQTVNDKGEQAPTDRYFTSDDTDAQAVYGIVRYSVSTELTNIQDAGVLAAGILAQSRFTGWRMDGLALDTAAMPDELESVDDATRATAFFNLLDGTTRMGAPITLADLPIYAPRGGTDSMYVEGGRCTFDGYDWRLEMITTPSAGQGQSAAWGDMPPEWQWQELSPDIQWLDAFGASVAT
jgi:hypothetical protein